MDFSDRLVTGGYAACAAIALGSLAPWAKAGPFAQSGVEGIGLTVLGLGIFAGYVLYRWNEYPNRDWLIGLGIVALLCLASTAFFVISPTSILDRPKVSVAWGPLPELRGLDRSVGDYGAAVPALAGAGCAAGAGISAMTSHSASMTRGSNWLPDPSRSSTVAPLRLRARA